MLWQRILSALVLIPIVAFLAWWHPLAYMGLILLIVCLMLYEFSGFARAADASIPVFLFIGVSLLVSIPDTVVLGLLLTVFLAPGRSLFRRSPEGCFRAAGAWVLGTLYIAWAFGYHLILLRQEPKGLHLITFLVLVIWMTDTLAYTVGTLFGKHPLMPSISPKKTIEGTTGGLIGGIFTGWAVWRIGLQDVFSWQHALLLSLLLSIVAQMSDLIESAIKRDIGVKDSGRLIPGHGGMLDRCDSLIFTAPTMYYYVQLVINRHGPGWF